MTLAHPPLPLIVHFEVCVPIQPRSNQLGSPGITESRLLINEEIFSETADEHPVGVGSYEQPRTQPSEPLPKLRPMLTPPR
jgi:hypothetical protein